MYILTDKYNHVITISKTLDYQNNGNYLVKDGTLVIYMKKMKELMKNMIRQNIVILKKKDFILIQIGNHIIQ